MDHKIISTKEYANARGITSQAVCNAIKKGYRLPGVIDHVLIGNSYILTINVDQLNNFVKKNKRNKLHV